jgi:hypothetical protein
MFKHSPPSRAAEVALRLPIRLPMMESISGLLRRITTAGLVLVAACALSSCDEKLSDIAGPESPNLQPTFTSIKNEIFSTTDLGGRTACITCHTNQGRNPPQGLNLLSDPYNALVNVPSRERQGAVLVIPGDPESSYLIRKLEGRDIANTARMPQNGPPYLTTGQIQIIRRWIETGAANN